MMDMFVSVLEMQGLCQASPCEAFLHRTVMLHIYTGQNPCAHAISLMPMVLDFDGINIAAPLGSVQIVPDLSKRLEGIGSRCWCGSMWI